MNTYTPRPSLWTRLFVFAALSAILGLAACSVAKSVQEQAPTTCSVSKDCLLGMICNSSGHCVTPQVDGDLVYCTASDECPTGQFCDNGVCVPPAQPDGDEVEADTEVVPDGDTEVEEAPAVGELTVVAELDFPPLQKGESLAKELLLAASDKGPVTITKLALASRTSPDYTLQNAPSGLPVVIEAGKTLTLSVQYLQSNIGFDTGAVEIESDAANGTSKTVELRVKTIGQPGISCTPESLPFGTVPVNGATNSLSVVCKNVLRQAGDDNVLQITSLTIDPAPNPHYSLEASVSSGIYLRSDHQATFSVEFSPVIAGEQDATLKLFHNAPDTPSPLTIPLTGKGGQRLLTPDRSTIHYGETRIGSTRREHVILTANGDMPVTITAIAAKSGSNPSPFSVEIGDALSNGPKVLAPNETLGFDVLFSPASKPGVSGSVEISSDASGASPLKISLDGSGTTFYVYTEPGAADFGPVTLGKSKRIDLSLINAGGQLTVFKAIQMNAPDGVFTLDAVQTPFSININGSLSLHLTFTPPTAAEGSYSGSLVFVVDDAQETKVTLPLSGTGALPHLALDPADQGLHDFGASVLGTNKTFTYLVKNTGLVPLTVSNLGFVTSAGDPYEVFKASFEGSKTIEANAQRNLVFTLDLSNTSLVPSALPLAVTRDYGFLSDDPAAANVSLKLNAQVVAPVPKLSFAGSLYDFGNNPPDCDADPLVLTLTNIGSGPLRVTDIHIASDYATDFRLSGLPTLPLEIQAASLNPANPDSVSFSVIFRPSVTGLRNATLYVTNEGYTNKNMTLTLTGKGVVCGSSDAPGTHSCGCRCVAKLSPEHCGDNCEPCSTVTHGAATCLQSGNVYSCGLRCDTHFVLTDGQCVPQNTVDCCGENCLDCRQNEVPAFGTAACDKSTSSCSFTCDAGYHREQTLCVRNTTADHCGTADLDCTKIPLTGKHADPACDNGSCSISCWQGYADCALGGINGDGCESDLTSDPNHCGSCDMVCPINNNTPVCVSRQCKVGECKKGFGDCDGYVANGCEVDLTRNIGNCGVCGAACTVANGTPGCSNSTCVIASCNANYRDCDKDVTTGCESYSLNDIKNCGYCGNQCLINNAEAKCESGLCKIKNCNSGFMNCDGGEGNGCEINTDTNLANCGGCGSVCAPAHAKAKCALGICSIDQCNLGYADCNDSVGDGCEVYTGNDVNNCGTCHNRCSFPNATAVCFNSQCLMAACLPGFYDVDGRPENGCEANTQSDPNNCGIPPKQCVTPTNMTTSRCVDGQCYFGACLPSYANCDSDIENNGCEVNLATNLNNCGGCGNRCLIANGGGVCAAGFCLVNSCNAGYQDCNKLDVDGCEIGIGTDPLNCGGCGQLCDLPQVDENLCSIGKCKIGTCDTGYADCNHVVDDGCEQNVASDVDNCGSCGHSCSFQHSTGICSVGECLVTSCNSGYGSCDGSDDNGCETNLNTNQNTCSSYVNMQRADGGLSISGDKGGDRTIDYTGWGNKWFRVYVTENDSTFLSPKDLTATFVLEVPPGTDYDLYLRRDDGTTCGGLVKASVNSGFGVDDGACLTQSDDQGIGGHGDDFWVNVEVRFFAGASCEPWRLHVIGNQGCSN